MLSLRSFVVWSLLFPRLRVGLVGGAVGLAFVSSAAGQESPKAAAGQVAPKAKAQVIPHHQDVAPGPALSPGEAMAKMKVPEGFTVELVASEPEIVNPVAMTFDERGRIWITESLEYPRKQPGEGRDRIKVLEDTDGDGKADKFTIFAEGLNIPSGIAVGHGGVWVANAPDILFLQDTDGDGKADKREVVVTGFGRADTHELPNSFTWGPDGWLYGLNGVFNHSHVKYVPKNRNYKADHPGWPITCALYRIHPMTREFQVFCEGTSNPWGIAIDGEGSFFVSACVIDHLWHLVETGYYHRQGGPYPPFTWKIESIVKHKHQKAAYCGIHWFDSDAYPEQYRGKLYMGNIHGNCINVDSLRRDGSTYSGSGEPDFLTANDAWFMPVAQKTGPDGCLYILDWYDQYHCYQDANRDPAGIDRLKGRLYRIRYKDTPRAKPFDLHDENDDQLIQRLYSENDYFRHLAHRLLAEQNHPRTRRQLWDIVFTDAAPRKTRLHALWALISAFELETDRHVQLLSHADPTFRAWGVRAAANIDSGFWKKLDPAVRTKVVALAEDESPEVLLQVAIAAKRLRGTDAVSLLLKVMRAAGSDQVIPHVVWQNLHPLLEDKSDEFLSEVAKQDAAKSRGFQAMTPHLVNRLLAAKSTKPQTVAKLAASIREKGSGEGLAALLDELVRAVKSGQLAGARNDAFKAALVPELTSIVLNQSPGATNAKLLLAMWGDSQSLAACRQMLLDAKLNSQVRVAACEALIAARDPEALSSATKVLASRAPADLHGAILAALGRLEEPQVAEVVLTAYPQLAAAVQPKAVELLTQRAAWGKRLVEAIGSGKLAPNVLNANQAQKLVSLGDAELTAAVAKHWGTVRTTRDPAREAFVGEMRRLVRNTPGDVRRGIEVFSRVCGQCHKIHGQGQDVGPDITLNGRASFEQLLSNVFDPSLVIGVSYQARMVQTTDGRIITGLLVEDSPQRVVLKVQGGKLETIARDDVEATKISELSLMPEGLEKQLQPQEIADLFAFITLDKHPDDAAARPIPSGR